MAKTVATPTPLAVHRSLKGDAAAGNTAQFGERYLLWQQMSTEDKIRHVISTMLERHGSNTFNVHSFSILRGNVEALEKLCTRSSEFGLPLEMDDIINSDSLAITALASEKRQLVFHARAAEYWAKKLDGATQMHLLPCLGQWDRSMHGATKMCSIEGAQPLSTDLPGNLSVCTLIRAAWAIILSRYLDTNDVCFGTTTSGPHRIETMPLPMRADVNVHQLKSDFLAQMERQYREMICHRLDLTQIAALSSDAEKSCDFTSLLNIQISEELDIEGAPTKLPVDDLRYPFYVQAIVSLNHITLRITFCTDTVKEVQARGVRRHLQNVLATLISENDMRLGDISPADCWDLQQALDWNFDVIPEAGDFLIHEKVSNNARYSPNHVAVDAWNGRLSYGELEGLSNDFANDLASRGIIPGQDLIPICFEKSMWYVVGVLGILKSGAAFVPLDPSHPKERLRILIQDLGAHCVITSSHTGYIFNDIEGISTIELPQYPMSPLQTHTSISRGRSPWPAYVIYTSGSTGKPKGIVIEHETLSAAMAAHVRLLGLNESSRVLQFSSHVFDISVFDIFGTLLAGGTVCIPSGKDRLQNLGEFVTSKSVDTAILTPSFVDTLNPDDFKTLRSLVLAGEPVSSHNLTTWFGRVNLINAYGPTETCVVSTSYSYSSVQDNPRTIGRGFHQRCWIVEASNPQRLAPIGGIGELLIEGPMALGYFKDALKTEENFLCQVKWLPHSTSRFYRTGDLARYQPDGTIECLGRRDTQVKFRGQRIELGEIEQAIRKYLPQAQQIVVDIVHNGQRDALAAFMTLHSESTEDATREVMFTLDKITATTISELTFNLKSVLPRYMIPALFLPVSVFPVSSSLKIDKRRLRGMVAELSPTHLSNLSPERTVETPLSFVKGQMRGLWANVLGVSPDYIGRDDSFLKIGGDSFAAIRLVSMARRSGIGITVASLFSDMPLSQLALTADVLDRKSIEQICKPFSLVDREHFLAMQDHIREQCNLLDSEVIEDAYPCTPLQEGFMALSLKQPGSYIDRLSYRLSDHVEIARFEAAWKQMVSQTESLRTRIVHVDGVTYQVIARGDASNVKDASSVNDYGHMSYGSPLFRWQLHKHSSGPIQLNLLLHHAINDGWSKGLMLQHVNSIYYGLKMPSMTPFSPFVDYVRNIDYAAAQEYWGVELRGAKRANFPFQAYKPDSVSHEARLIKQRVHITKRPLSNITRATLLRSAWAILLAQYCETDDICFGETVSGRQAELPYIATISGPVIATVPVRVKLHPDQTVQSFLQNMQKETLNMIAFEQHGLQNIAKSCSDAREACDFRSFLIIQADSHALGDLLTDISTGNMEEAEQGYFTHPLNVQAFLTSGDEVNLRLAYHADVMNQRQVIALCNQIEHIAKQLASADDGCTLGELSTAGPWDIEQYSQASGSRPMTDSCVHWLIEEKIKENPARQAVEAWDQSLTYGKLGRLSTNLAGKLLQHGIRSEELILFCVSKSSWAAVAMVSTQMAGAAFVPIDPCPTQGRLLSVLEQTEARFALVSRDTLPLFDGSGITCIVVEEQDYESPAPTLSVKTHPGQISWITFTSGSTGQPKGIVMQHDATCSASNAMGWAIGKAPGVRVYQFSAYTFDAGVLDTLVTLMRGGCVCIPSEEARKNDVGRSINALKANFVTLTPSVAGLLCPGDVPSLKRMALTGEAVTQAVVDRWKDHVELIGTYGPAETSVCSWNSSLPENGKPWNIGKPLSSAFWVVNPDRPDQLVPAGCVGELVIHGVLLARGYLKPSTNADKWITVKDEWMIPGLGSRAYRSGDLVRLNHDGSYDYLGRRDTQVKINGQRTELAEIELHIQKLLPKGMQNIVDYVKNDGISAYLLVYLYDAESTCTQTSLAPNPTEEHTRLVAKLYSALSNVLPTHMIPSVYLPLVGRPERTVSGKIDRRKLAAIARGLSSEQRLHFSSSYRSVRQPSTTMERRLCKLWAHILSIESSCISAEDNFLHLGGDSVSAMRLVMLSRRNGIILKVQTIFQSPQLERMALAAVSLDDKDSPSVVPFSQVGRNEVELCQGVLQKRHGSIDLEDLFPCTKLQEGFIALAIKHPGSYIAKFVYKIEAHVDTARFLSAWKEVVRRCSNLRTVVMQTGNSFAQAILRYDESTSTLWEPRASTCVRLFLGSDVAALAEPGSFLSETALVQETSGQRYFALRIHHAAFDGWTLELMLETLDKVYNSLEPKPSTSLAGFIEHVQRVDIAAAAKFWTTYLQGAPTSTFPTYDTKTTAARGEIIQHITLPQLSGNAVTLANILTAAWAMVLSRYCDNNDVCFGTTLSGRGASVAGLDSMVGPTIATVPIRIQIDTQSTDALLAKVQKQAVEMSAFEQFGLANIAAVSAEARAACTFSNLFVIQPPAPVSDHNGVLTVAKDKMQLVQETSQHFINYPLVVELTPDGDCAAMRISFDTSAMNEMRAIALCKHFQNAVDHLVRPGNVHDISLAGEWDIQEAVARNTEDLSAFDVCVHDLIAKHVEDFPNKDAIFSTERVISYAELDGLTTRLAAYLQQLGVGPEVIVPYCFEKSIWAVVSVVSIIKAGGAFMPMDPKHPYEYRQKLAEQVAAQVILASQEAALACEGMAPHLVTVSESLPIFNTTTVPRLSKEKASPSSPIYVIFSSGSTGIPKGIIIEHRAFASALRGHSHRYSITCDTRFFHFSSYVFDVACSEILTILACGATLCVPTEEERMQQTARFITESRSDMAFLTPSFARDIDPGKLPTLKTLLIGGEAPTADIVQNWAGTKRLINAYGPAEDSVYSVTHQFSSSTESPATIGKPVNNAAWVVDTDRPDRLAPIGCVGELVLQGPAIARGYVDRLHTSTASFFSNVLFLPFDVVQCCPRFYATGDLVRYLDNGDLLYVGRRDTQVKLRGQRIELGEIEAMVIHAGTDIGHVVVEVLRQGPLEALVAFISFKGTYSTVQKPLLALGTDASRRFFTKLSHELCKQLP